MWNDKALDPSTTECPGIPAFETLEGFDCGEGIHLTGVDHATVSTNVVVHNAGGILLSDDTGPTHDNLISGNLVQNNPYDCGITLASHPAAFAQTPQGVYHNTISQNNSSFNGLAVEGAGAGVGIFDSVPGAMNYGNVVINNQLTNNGLPGVTMHSHTPNQVLNDNVIVGNWIAGNHADTEDAATPGPTGINVFGVSAVTGTLISQNVFWDEGIDVAVSTPAEVSIRFNSFPAGSIGVDNLGSGTVDAIQNWWGCAAGPVSAKCASVGGTGVTVAPWLMKPFGWPNQ